MPNVLYDLAIIGGGPGGLSAAIYAARAKLKTVLLEYGTPGGQLNITDKVENYLGFDTISGHELASKFTNHAKLYDFEILELEVLNLKKKKFTYKLTLSNQQILKSKTVILATGGSPRKLQIPGEKELYGNGISYCATCDGFFFKNKDVLVVGGGNSAAEESLYLAKLCNKVYLSHRRDKLSASKFLQTKVLENEKIVILWNKKPTLILSENDELTGVKLIDTKTYETHKIKVQGVFIFIGYEPNTKLVSKQVSIDPSGMVITDESCESNLPGLYAVGDIRFKPARQIVLSVADGCNAALAASKYIEKLEK